MKKIKAVIFDLDGTLANTLPLCIAAFRKAIEPLIMAEVSDQQIIDTFGPSEEGTIMALAPEFYDKGVADYIKHYTEMHHMCPAPFEGVVQILEHLKKHNIRTAMVTGKGRASAEISLQRFDIQKYFGLLKTGHPQRPSKPEGIKAVMDTWSDLDKDEVIYVGDAPSDVLACGEADIPIVAAAWAETAEPEKLIPLSPDKLFYTVSDFKKWLYNAI